MPGTHAILSPSSSERWINCPPSAMENAAQTDTGSSYAQQGTDAHALCEYKVKKALGYKVRDPTDNLEFYDEEMEECSDAYLDFIMEQVAAAKQTCPDPLVLVEHRLDFTRWVAESFGTADCIIVADGTMTIVDFKYGLGVLVDAENNSQMRMYAGCYFINANSATKPGVVDADCQPILDTSELYSGIYGRASINFYAFNTNGNKGIACGLNNLQKLRDGEPLGGKSRAEDDFSDMDDDDDDFLS